MPPLVFPPRLNLAQIPTPLQPLDRLSEQLGGPRIWLKRDDLTGCALSGNKVRKLEFVLAKALEMGCDTLISCGGLQSNHCRATALLGAQLGLRVCLILRGQPEGRSEGNYLLDQLAGAEIRCYPPEQYRDQLDQLLEAWAQEYRQQGCQPWIIPTGASDGTGVWGYVAASEELQNDYRRLGMEPEWILSAAGSGGTLAGLSLGHHWYSPRVKVLGLAVCDSADYFRRKVARDLTEMAGTYHQPLPPDLAAPQVTEDYIGAGYALAGPEVFDTIRLLARTEGQVLDPVYTGKAFYGMLEELRRGRFDGCGNIVFVHTGGIFGLFPFGDGLTY